MKQEQRLWFTVKFCDSLRLLADAGLARVVPVKGTVPDDAGKRNKSWLRNNENVIALYPVQVFNIACHRASASAADSLDCMTISESLVK